MVALSGIYILLVFLIDQRKLRIVCCAIVEVFVDGHWRLLHIVVICQVGQWIGHDHGTNPSMIRCHQSLPYFYNDLKHLILAYMQTDCYKEGSREEVSD